jgi:hypothetical protein
MATNSTTWLFAAPGARPIGPSEHQLIALSIAAFAATIRS